MGQIPPLAAGAEPVKNGVDDFSQRNFLVSSLVHFARQERMDESPLGIRNVGRIGFARLCGHKELRSLGQLVSGYLDFAERQAERELVMTMKDWSEHLDRILTMSGENLLRDSGSISHEQAVNKATTEYKKYQQKTLSEVEKKLFGKFENIRRENENKKKKTKVKRDKK